MAELGIDTGRWQIGAVVAASGRLALPLGPTAAIKTPVLLLHGERDDVVPVEETLRATRILKNAGFEVDARSKRAGFDGRPDRVAFFGFSQGAIMLGDSSVESCTRLLYPSRPIGFIDTDDTEPLPSQTAAVERVRRVWRSEGGVGQEAPQRVAKPSEISSVRADPVQKND